MKILMVSSYLPYPLINGGNIRLYNLLKNLSKSHEITLFCEKRKFQTEKDIDEVRKYCKKVVVFNRKEQWTFENIIKAFFSKNPFLMVGHTLLEMKIKLRKELIENNFDLIHLETFYILQNIPNEPLPIVLAEHNIEYMVYQRFANLTKRFIRPFLNWDIEKLKKKEIDAWKKASRLIAVSNAEKGIMENILRKKVEVVPNGVDLDYFRMPPVLNFENKEKRVLFIGDFKWIENRESLNFILEKIWPKIKTKFNAKLWIVGQNIPQKIKERENKDIILDRNIIDTPKIFERAFILLSPIKVGGGTSFKILEAMACGVPVVTTKLGIEGIGGDICLTGETNEEIIEKIEELFLNRKLYEGIANKARKFIEENYDWKKISKKLDSVYLSLKND